MTYDNFTISLILYFNYMYKKIKCMWNKLLYINFILYAVILVADFNRKIKIFVTNESHENF